jgi:hypothetical protein
MKYHRIKSFDGNCVAVSINVAAREAYIFLGSLFGQNCVERAIL